MIKIIYFGIGCFWGGQKYFDQIKGIEKTNVGYLNGPYKNVNYKEVCAGSGHVEVVEVNYNNKISESELFSAFIRIINPFSINKQGNDQGVQYRTGIYWTFKEQKTSFTTILKNWENKNKTSTIEIIKAHNFVLAENYHQKYLDKNSNGYCHINLNNIPHNLKKYNK